MYRDPAGRRTTLWSAVYHEHEDLLEEEAAGTKKSAKEPAYRAYRAFFSHFPRTRPFGKTSAASGAQRNGEKIPCSKTWSA